MCTSIWKNFRGGPRILSCGGYTIMTMTLMRLSTSLPPSLSPSPSSSPLSVIIRRTFMTRNNNMRMINSLLSSSPPSSCSSYISPPSSSSPSSPSSPSCSFTSSRQFHSTNKLSKEDFYKVLGVSKSATKNEIKKKYFELAKKYHPDVNKAPEAESKFREISEAYEILENDEKRNLYDQFGHAGVDPQNAGFGGGGFEGFNGPFGGFPGGFQGGQQVDPQDIFEMFEGMFGGEGARGKGRDVQQVLNLSFFEAVNGCSKEVTVQFTDRKTPGKVQTKKVKVTVPPGVDDGVVMRVGGEGGIGMSGKPNGDLRLNIRVAKDPYFIREGPNLHVEQPISIVQAILGGKTDVLTLNGMLEVKIPPGTQPDAKLVLRGKGVKDVNSIHRGDQYIHLKIKIPKNLTPKQKELLLEFEKEGTGVDGAKATKESSSSSGGGMSSTLESAWNRLKEFMGTKEEETKEKKGKGKEEK